MYSELGKGTTFKIYLPVSAEKHSEKPENASASITGGNETILVVDDDSSIRRLIQDILKPLGYRILLASDGDEALDMIKKNGSVDVLLTDVIMPNMNGRQLADIFFRDYPGVKVIFMSGHTDETITQQGVLSEGDVLIEKPLSPSKLTSRLREILDRKQ